MLISLFADVEEFICIVASSSKNSQFPVKMRQSSSFLPVRLNLIGSFYFDWHILTGSCEFFEELLRNIAELSNEFLNVSK